MSNPTLEAFELGYEKGSQEATRDTRQKVVQECIEILTASEPTLATDIRTRLIQKIQNLKGEQ